MAEKAREFFETLESRTDESKTAGMTATYLFDVDGAGKWTVDVNDGKLNVTEGGDQADCTISWPAPSFSTPSSSSRRHCRCGRRAGG